MPTADSPLFVCTVGGSPAPIIHSLRAHQPRRVLFVCSGASAAAVTEQILPALDGVPLWRVLSLADEQDLLACVTDIRAGLANALEAWGLPANTALLGDFTGGTKVMSAALVMALMEYDVQFTYVGGGPRTKDGLGLVQDGAERILHLANPWQAMACTRIQQLVDAFNAYQFHEAEQLARHIAAHGVRPDLFTALATLSRAYALWDSFDYAEAETLFIHALPAVISAAPRAMAACLEHVRANCLALRKAATELADFMENRRACPNYLRDLAANALRRERQRRYDDAVARLYSLLEKAAKTTLLCVYDLDTSRLVPEALPQDFLREAPPIVSHDGMIQLPLFRSYQLLACLKHPLGLRFMEQQPTLNALLQSRNASLLAHGFAPVSCEDCVQLRCITMKFLDLSIDQLTTFPRLDAAALH